MFNTLQRGEIVDWIANKLVCEMGMSVAQKQVIQDSVVLVSDAETVLASSVAKKVSVPFLRSMIWVQSSSWSRCCNLR